jgi:hypothetical protein
MSPTTDFIGIPRSFHDDVGKFTNSAFIHEVRIWIEEEENVHEVTAGVKSFYASNELGVDQR